MIVCVLMCGGKGSRLCINSKIKMEKPLLRLGNKLLIEYAIDAVQKSKQDLELYAAVSSNAQKTKEFLKSKYFDNTKIIETTGTGFSNDYLSILQFFKDRESERMKLSNKELNMARIHKILFLPVDLPLISFKTLEQITDLEINSQCAAIIVDKKMFIQHNFNPSIYTTIINKIEYCYTGISIVILPSINGNLKNEPIKEELIIIDNFEFVFNINTLDDLKRAVKKLQQVNKKD